MYKLTHKKSIFFKKKECIYLKTDTPLDLFRLLTYHLIVISFERIRPNVIRELLSSFYDLNFVAEWLVFGKFLYLVKLEIIWAPPAPDTYRWFRDSAHQMDAHRRTHYYTTNSN